MILSCQNISKAFNDEPVLCNVSFHMEDYDKAAIVGINGAGSLLLSMHGTSRFRVILQQDLLF